MDFGILGPKSLIDFGTWPKLLMDFGTIVPKLLIDFGTIVPKLLMDFGTIVPKLLMDFGTWPKITNGFWEAQKTYRILGYFYPQNY